MGTSGAAVQELSYDAWGRPRNPDDWGYANTPGSPYTNRGYTFHEQLGNLGLVNMNGRLYDPLVGRFLGPDNLVQSPGLPQSFNRYAYCMNNPLRYIDPSGYTWWSHFTGWAGDVAGKAAATTFKLATWQVTLLPSTIEAISNQSWSRLDPFYKGTISNNCYQITTGFIAGSPKQILSRVTWELPQTVIGFGYSQFINYIGKVNTVDRYDGATVLKCYGDGIPLGGGPALTLGSFIVGNNTIAANPNNPLFQHEYGHYLQSQVFGWAYLSRVAIPSLLNAKFGDNHDYLAVEQDANVRAIQYFYKRTGGNFTWWFIKNPIGYAGGRYWTMEDYNTSEFQSLLRSLKVNPTWYDYAGWAVCPIGPVLLGWYNYSTMKNISN